MLLNGSSKLGEKATWRSRLGVESGSGATTNLAVTTSDGVVVSTGGSIGANLTAVNTTIPDYMQQLNSVADSLATNLNALQSSGMNAAGDPGSTIAGGYPGTVLPPIFVNNGSSNTYTTALGTFNSAATIQVSQRRCSHHRASLIATAAAPGPSNSNTLGSATLDGSNAQAMAALASLATGPDATYQTLIGALERKIQAFECECLLDDSERTGSDGCQQYVVHLRSE